MSSLDKIDLGTEMSVEMSMNGSAEVNEKSPKISSCRLAVRRDLREIGKLVKCRTLKLFPDAQRLDTIYEKSCLAIVQENQLKEIVSVIFLCNYPNIPAVSPSAWFSWMNKLYDVKDASTWNTLFVHLVVWDERRYQWDLLVDLLTATFYVVARCDYVVLVLPPTIEPAHGIREVMTRVAPKNESDEVQAQALYVGDRRQFVPRMKFRLAFEEDNDDVVQMLDNDTTLLREIYGDFYISEMSRHPDPWRQVVIGDTDDRVAIIACFNEKIDLELLNDRFELGAFDGLRKKTLKLVPSIDDSEEEHEDYSFQVYNTDNETSEVLNTNEAGIEFSSTYWNENDSDDEEDWPVTEAHGDAFALELLGFRWDKPLLLASSRNLLVAAFERFPRLRYCLALMPTDKQHFPFLDHFTRVPLKADKDFSMALYVVHRALIHGELRVREVRREDREAVYRLLEHSRNILDDFKEAFNDERDEARRCYVFSCDDVIAGLAIVCTEEKNVIDRLGHYYRVEDLLGSTNNCERSQIDAAPLRLLRLALAPIFQPSTEFFLVEIMRLEANNAMLYRLKRIEDAPSCLSMMQAVKPRIRNWPQLQRYFKREHEDSPFKELFSLYVTSPRLTMMTKQIVNVKIIVVGASNCGLAFVDALVSGYKYRDLQFTDITLISTNGYPYENSNDHSVRTMIPFRGRYCDTYRDLTSGRINYNVVKGTVVQIDRKKRQVYIEDSGTLSYDYLVLTCGLLFQVPEFTKDSNPANDGAVQVPPNYFSINDHVEAVKCLTEIQKLTKNFQVQKSIVFYGCNIECYCALAAFLELGLEGSWITLIEPKLLASDDIFNGDCEIRDQLREIILGMGVKLLSGYNLTEWKLDSYKKGYGSRIENVVLQLENDKDDVNDDAVGPIGRVVICDALLGFHVKSPCLKTFLAISHAGLVFDGRLVIDAEFRTNDRRVFAAGTMTKYSRRLRTAYHEHQYFNSLQVGEKLAEKFVSITTADSDEAPSEQFTSQSAKLPEFQAPIIVSCLLPGGYRYLHVRKPGARLANDRAQSKDDVFTTGSCTADTGYFRLRLNQFNTLECVTCFSKTDYDIQNMIALYGKHEALFNDLKTRFLNDEITDFYAYFREPWATALFSDDFDELCLRRKRSDRTVHSNEQSEPRENLFEEVTNVLKNTAVDYNKMTMKDHGAILSNHAVKGQAGGFEEEVKERLIEYLECHEDKLSMYSTPEKRRQILQEIADTPLLGDCDDICQSSLNSRSSSGISNGDNATRVLESASDCRCSSSSSGSSSNEIVLT